MTEENDNKRASRRRFLAGAAGLAAAGVAGASRADDKNLPPNVADWSKTARRWRRRSALRPSVEIRKRRHPPRRAVAHRQPRVLGQLHAAARTRRHHHAERAVLRASSCRHRRNRSERLPADHSWPRRQAFDLHARRPQAAAARQPYPLPRMRRQFRHGVARRTAQRLPVHARHGAYRAIHRRAAEAFAGAGGREAERQMADG